MGLVVEYQESKTVLHFKQIGNLLLLIQLACPDQN